MKKSFLLLFTLIGLCLSAIGQEVDNTEEVPPRSFLLLTPQTLLVGKASLGFERDLTSKHSLLSTLSYTQRNLTNWNSGTGESETNDLTGFGLELIHKIYTSPSGRTSRWYFMHGPRFNHLQDVGQGIAWVQSTDSDGNQILTSQDVERTTKINQFAYSFAMGNRLVVGNTFVCDFFMGILIQQAKINQVPLDGEETINGGYDYPHDETWFDPGYSGNMLLAGIRIGLGM